MKRHTVGEIMTTDVLSVHETTGFKEIVETLAELRFSALPVVGDDGRVLGVVSEADLMYKVELAGDRTPPRLLQRKRERTARAKSGADIAKGLMTTPPVVIEAHETVATAARLMDTERIKLLPVVDRGGRLVGVVTRRDVLRQYLRADDEIRREVIDEVLVRALWIDPTDLVITVDRGVVALSGPLDRHSEIAIVVNLVRMVAGVVGVLNHLCYRYDDTHGPARPMEFAA